MHGAEALHQDANIQGPRRGQGIALTVDVTARAYDMRTLPWNVQSFSAPTDIFLYLDFQNDGTFPIYYYFSPAVSPVDLDDASVIAAGTPLLLDPKAPKLLRASQDATVRIQCDIDQFLVIKSTGGPTVLRIMASSH